MRRNDAAMPRRSRPLLDRPPTAVHYRARYLKLNGRLMEPSQRVGVALRLLLDACTLAPGRASSATQLVALIATSTNAVASPVSVADKSLIGDVLEILTTHDKRYRRPHNQIVRNLPLAKFRGKLLLPTKAAMTRDAEARRELLVLAAAVDGGVDEDLPPVLPPVQLELRDNALPEYRYTVREELNAAAVAMVVDRLAKSREANPAEAEPAEANPAEAEPATEPAAPDTSPDPGRDDDDDETQTAEKGVDATKPAAEDLPDKIVPYSTKWPDPLNDLDGYLEWLKGQHAARLRARVEQGSDSAPVQPRKTWRIVVGVALLAVGCAAVGVALLA